MHANIILTVCEPFWLLYIYSLYLFVLLLMWIAFISPYVTEFIMSITLVCFMQKTIYYHCNSKSSGCWIQLIFDALCEPFTLNPIGLVIPKKQGASDGNVIHFISHVISQMSQLAIGMSQLAISMSQLAFDRFMMLMKPLLFLTHLTILGCQRASNGSQELVHSLMSETIKLVRKVDSKCNQDVVSQELEKRETHEYNLSISRSMSCITWQVIGTNVLLHY